MEFSTWLVFTGIALVSIISPGPAVLLSVTNSLTHGLSKSVCSSLGNIAGIFIVAGAAVLGLGAVLETSIVLFTLLKIVGALYLIHLGIRQWRNGFLFPGNPTGKTGKNVQSKRRSFFQGFFVAVSNPKAVLFFTALFPQFLDLSKPLILQFMVLTATFMLLSFATLVLYAKSAGMARTYLSAGNRGTCFNKICGTVYILFGLGLLRVRNRVV